MATKVIDVRHLRTKEQRSTVIYVGRRFAGWPVHPLANIFIPNPDTPVGTCIKRYTRYLLARPDYDERIAELRAEVAATGKPLGCWCLDWDGDGEPPMRCHAVVLALAVDGKLKKEGDS